MRISSLILLCISILSWGQIPAYYSGIDFSPSNNMLQSDLSNLVKSTHHTRLSYTPGVWEALKVLDLNPQGSDEVLLIYGYDDNDQSTMNDRSRNKNLSCHQTTCTGKWNREHVYPKSIGEFTNDGYAITDVHALRASDTEMNSYRYNSPFVDGSGHAQEVYSYRFYPGDEWKGDVARMILYMYLRYPNKCKPNYVGIDRHTYHTQIPDIFLEWNAEDPVSDFEIRRNNLIADAYQGNRNPFIDNPYLATLLWGGPTADDLWGVLSIENMSLESFIFYPNPTKDKVYYPKDNFTAINVYNMAGQRVKIDENLLDNSTELPSELGMYIIEFCKGNKCKQLQVIKN